MNFVTFADNWNPTIPTNPVLLPRALAAIGHRVLMVEARSRRNDVTLRPWIWRRIKSHSPQPNLTVLEYAPALPSRLWLTAPMAAGQFRAKVARVMKQLWGGEKAYLIVFSPNDVKFRAAVPDMPFAYRVIDDYPTMPFYAADPEGCRQLDEQLCREAVAVFPSNPKLLEQRRHLNPRHLLVPNGVNFSHFAQEGLAVPDGLRSLPRPIVGFSGAVDAYKVDFGLLRDLAALRPQWSFVLVGKVGTCDDTSAEELPQAPNLHYLGFLPFDLLPAFTAAFDVGIIPYGVNPYTEGVSPLKLYEYLAAGKGVVSTPLPFADAAGDDVSVAATPDEFVAAIEKLLAETGAEERRRSAARANSWDVRAGTIADYLSSL